MRSCDNVTSPHHPNHPNWPLRIDPPTQCVTSLFVPTPIASNTGQLSHIAIKTIQKTFTQMHFANKPIVTHLQISWNCNFKYLTNIGKLINLCFLCLFYNKDDKRCKMSVICSWKYNYRCFLTKVSNLAAMMSSKSDIVTPPMGYFASCQMNLWSSFDTIQRFKSSYKCLQACCHIATLHSLSK